MRYVGGGGRHYEMCDEIRRRRGRFWSKMCDVMYTIVLVQTFTWRSRLFVCLNSCCLCNDASLDRWLVRGPFVFLPLAAAWKRLLIHLNTMLHNTIIYAGLLGIEVCFCFSLFFFTVGVEMTTSTPFRSTFKHTPILCIVSYLTRHTIHYMITSKK